MRNALELNVLQVNTDSTLVVVEIFVRHLFVVLVEDALHNVLAVQDTRLTLLSGVLGYGRVVLVLDCCFVMLACFIQI